MDTHRKALEINLDSAKYGVFAEIGAGQEVARWFFRVGGASGTIAKTISAYDMTMSDAIYGPASRYVSRERLEKMLDHEFTLTRERLSEKCGAEKGFFVFADTVAARSFSRVEDTHGWMGVRFQHLPGAEPSQLIIHIRLLDKEAVAQQEAIGILGVNLLYAAFRHNLTMDAFLASLLDNLTPERVEVDMIAVSGPAFAGQDNRLLSLMLVQKGLTHAALISSQGEVVQPSEILYKKPILVMRGSFRPPTRTMMDLLNGALSEFVQEPEVAGEEVVVLLEMTLKNLMEGGEINPSDFLARADMLGSMGKTVLISNYDLYYRLAEYLFGFTRRPIALAMGVPTLREVFNEKYYKGLAGGILESFGRMFENQLRVYAYPYRDPMTGALITAENLRVAPELAHLYAYLRGRRLIEPIRGFDESCLGLMATDALAMIREGNPAWRDLVPPGVARLIEERGLWGVAGEIAKPAG